MHKMEWTTPTGTYEVREYKIVNKTKTFGWRGWTETGYIFCPFCGVATIVNVKTHSMCGTKCKCGAKFFQVDLLGDGKLYAMSGTPKKKK